MKKLTIQAALEQLEAEKAVASRARKRAVLDQILDRKSRFDPTNEAIQQYLAAASYEEALLRARASGVVSAVAEDSAVLLIAIPQQYSALWPDVVTHNYGHAPHISCVYLNNLTEGEASEALRIIRAVCRGIGPFRVFVDAQVGLQDFGPGEDGEKALWMPVRSEPARDLERMASMVETALKREGIDIAEYEKFVPHATWAFVPNDFPPGKKREWDSQISDKFAKGMWFDVRHVFFSMGSTVKTVSLGAPTRG